MTTRRVLLFMISFASLARPASAAPGVAVLLTPNSEVTAPTIAFSWQADPEATWYQFWLGTPKAAALVYQQWYTAEQAGCLRGGTCTITVTPPLEPGGYVWYIQTWGGGTYGPWSRGQIFRFREPMPSWSRMLPDDRRFTVVLNGWAVLDSETGLVWEQQPTGALTWPEAVMYCLSSAGHVGSFGRRGFRLPSAEELSTLATLGMSSLPSPFNLGTVPKFWSQTSYPDTADVVVAHFDRPEVQLTRQAKTDSFRVWCVRAPTGATR